MPKKVIKWSERKYKYLPHLYKRTENDYDISVGLNRLEQVAFGELTRLCGNIVVDGKCLTPNSLSKLTEENKEDLYMFFADAGIDNFTVDIENNKIYVCCNRNTVNVPACLGFFLLDKLEFIEETRKPEEMEMIILHEAGIRTSLAIVQGWITKIYPWIRIKEQIQKT